jgi:hypothetical protein
LRVDIVAVLNSAAKSGTSPEYLLRSGRTLALPVEKRLALKVEEAKAAESLAVIQDIIF